MDCCLDSLGERRYKAAAFAAGLAFLLAAEAWAGGKPVVVHGALLPPESQQVGEDRYRSPLNFPETQKFYATAYKSLARRPVINQPGIKAFHIGNPQPGKWEGLNVYEQNGEVRIYVLKRLPK